MELSKLQLITVFEGEGPVCLAFSLGTSFQIWCAICWSGRGQESYCHHGLASNFAAVVCQLLLKKVADLVTWVPAMHFA